MAVRASREVVFDAPAKAIMDVLADVDALPTWSSVHRQVEIVDRYPDGKPHHVRATMRLLGITDKEILEYHWGDTWMVWDAEENLQQRGQHVEYNLTPEIDKTRVRFDITVDVTVPLPEFIVRRAKKVVLHVALDRLRQRVMGLAQPA
ncbi:SRPBCC family protein [Mycolicibacterium brisbanense]|uniref:Cyclase/dehydrase n=1 Tax=Mycolicibacterium brisbanense TaxID=146020 RepID=A0A100VV88_9MYCO|nr:SRPBCC family protein [Mycolicibacterium brisbanense]MCV7156765.1 SRPBCC family protein [Mycolicibacterium brisbanense]GAS86663.1 cyclase/dehydrase [Mycolicibacterium brisbanense]